MSQQGFQDRWIVDVRGQHRPMSTQEIILGLLQLELKIIFRVSKDGKEWKAICNEPYFEAAIKQFIEHYTLEATKYSQEGNENKEAIDEKSGFHNLNTITSSINEQLSHAQQLEEINAIVNSLRRILNDILAKRKMIIDTTRKDREMDELHPDDQNEYISEEPPFWKRISLQKASIVPILALFILAGYGKYQRMKEADNEAEAAKAAIAASALGEYDKALALVSSLNLNNLDSQTLIQIAEAQMKMKQYDKGKDALKIALTKTQNPKLLAMANAMLGLLSMQTNAFEQADIYLQASLKTENLYSTLYNLGISQLNEKKYAEAEATFFKAMQFKDADLGPVLMGLYEVALALDAIDAAKAIEEKKEPENIRLEKIFKMLFPVTYTSPEYSQELQLIRVLSSAKLKRYEIMALLIREFIQKPVLPTKPNRVAKIDESHTQWSYLYPWCESVWSEDSKDFLRNALLAACVARTKSPKEAIAYAEYSVQGQNDYAFMVQLAHLYQLTNQPKRAKEVLDKPIPDGFMMTPFAKEILDDSCKKIGPDCR